MLPVVLTIAGSDSGGGAGIQADLKTFFAHGVYGTTVITAITAQNTLGVYAIEDVSPEVIYLQAKAVFEDFSPAAVKIGMLSREETVAAVVKILKEFKPKWVVLDPVMVAKSGAPLLKEGAIALFKSQLLPLASVVTPNIPEAEVLTGISIKSVEDMKESARYLVEALGVGSALVKGGHLEGDPTDVFYDGKEFWVLPGKRITTKSTHGTGCTLSSAIAANLALGYDLLTSVKRAKVYVEKAIERAIPLGKGAGPLNHSWNVRFEWS
jgi:hydroxymethylpyrimidine/phosphomethylpyrimidine kinase